MQPTGEEMALTRSGRLLIEFLSIVTVVLATIGGIVITAPNGAGNIAPILAVVLIILVIDGFAFAGGFGWLAARNRARHLEWKIQDHGDMVTSLDALVGDAEATFSQGRAGAASLSWAGGQINQEVMQLQAGKGTPVGGVERVQECFYSWNWGEQHWVPVREEIRRLCRDEARERTSAFVAAMDLLTSYIGWALALTQRYVDAVRTVQGFTPTPATRDAWIEFKDHANSILARCEELLGKMKAEFGIIRPTIAQRVKQV